MAAVPTAGLQVDLGLVMNLEPVLFDRCAQGGFKRWIMGSVAERLVRESPAPVVIVPSHHED